MALYEVWDGLSIRGTYASSYINNVNAENAVITNPDGRWFYNNNDLVPSCGVFHNRLHFLDGKNPHGEGSLLTTEYLPFTNGMRVCTTFRQDGNIQANTFINFGIYGGEGNYRTIGVKNGFFTMWGPDKEANFNSPLYSVKPVLPNITHSLWVQYHKDNGCWRWDYFLDGVWVSGHFAIDNSYKLGPGIYPDNKARIVLCFGSFVEGVIAEGHYGPIEVLYL